MIFITYWPICYFISVLAPKFHIVINFKVLFNYITE